MENLTIIVKKINPPVPSNHFDWQAHVDGHEEWGTGFGVSAFAALFDLSEIVEGQFLTSKRSRIRR